MAGELKSAATIGWASGVQERAHDVVILPSGWLRVTWLDGATTHVSPAMVKQVFGKGVSYGA